ncbi:MAG: SGNH/GDSL hydrolase family protein [Terracidiphilus sp.]
MNRFPLRIAWFAAVALAGLLTPAALPAQEPGSLPEIKAPPAEQAPAAAQPAQTPAGAQPEAEAEPARKAPPASNWMKEHQQQMEDDWPFLGRFKKADSKLAPPAPGENRVVFMGDSITQDWKIEGEKGSFPGKPYINRGIKAQTTPQMLLRFRQDVIALQPKAVVILAGINDIAGNTGPETLEQIEDNLASMADLATANHIRVVLCSVLPSVSIPWVQGLKPAPKVLALNAWIKAYAAEMGYVYVDYHSAMQDERGGLPAALSKDGVHPLPAGYAIMAPLVEAGIAKALAQ